MQSEKKNVEMKFILVGLSLNHKTYNSRFFFTEDLYSKLKKILNLFLIFENLETVNYVRITTQA